MVGNLHSGKEIASRPMDAISARQYIRDIFDNFKRAMLSAGFTTSWPFRGKEELTDFLEHLRPSGSDIAQAPVREADLNQVAGQPPAGHRGTVSCHPLHRRRGHRRRRGQRSDPGDPSRRRVRHPGLQEPRGASELPGPLTPSSLVPGLPCGVQARYIYALTCRYSGSSREETAGRAPGDPPHRFQVRRGCPYGAGRRPDACPAADAGEVRTQSRSTPLARARPWPSVETPTVRTDRRNCAHRPS